jgi:hypothetical protein
MRRTIDLAFIGFRFYDAAARHFAVKAGYQQLPQ